MGEAVSGPRESIGAPSAPVLAVDGLSKRFGPITALSDVSLSLERGEIRAICGENGAGKSTLVKILTGVYRAGRGTIRIDGEVRDIRRPRHAQEMGLALVAQELSLAPDLSIYDNVWLGNRTVPLLHRRGNLRRRAREALETLGIGHLDLDSPVGALSIGERQLVEISRLLAREARVLILDEPTATLSDMEIEKIFAALRRLKAQGRSILYITHRLGEVFRVCDSVTVLRNGVHVGTRAVADIDRDGMIEMMLGRSFVEMYPDAEHAGNTPLLEVEGLSVPGSVVDFGMTAAAGKVVCIAGQIGSGATEVVRSLAGLTHDATGRVRVGGVPVPLGSVPFAQAHNIAFVSEDRAQEGIFLHLRVLDNLVSTRLGRYSRFGVVSWPRLREAGAHLAEQVGLDQARMHATADQLSGGNQQKLAFGRSIGHGGVGVLLMNEPTRGVDVGARAEIYALMQALCDLGYSLVMTSSDLEEVVGISDRIITMYRGRIVGRYERTEVDTRTLLADITHPRMAAESAV